MRKTTAIVVTALAFVVTGGSVAATPAGSQDRGGLVYRYYPGAGYRFQPLLSFANLQSAVSRRDVPTTRRLARALLARGVDTAGALYWPYDFSFGGGPSSWTSGFTQAVAANALARAGVLLRDDTLETAAGRAFAGLRRTLLLRMSGGGLWIREYSYTGQVILNAQLESVLELDSYASIARTASARTVARVLAQTSARLLPQFDLGCWGRYQLGGAAADTHYEAYHVDLLRRLAATHRERIWHDTYLRWSRCLR